MAHIVELPVVVKGALGPINLLNWKSYGCDKLLPPWCVTCTRMGQPGQLVEAQSTAMAGCTTADVIGAGRCTQRSITSGGHRGGKLGTHTQISSEDAMMVYLELAGDRDMGVP